MKLRNQKKKKNADLQGQFQLGLAALEQLAEEKRRYKRSIFHQNPHNTFFSLIYWFVHQSLYAATESLHLHRPMTLVIFRLLEE